MGVHPGIHQQCVVSLVTFPTEWTSSPISPPFNTTTLIKPMTRRKRRPLGRARTFAREGHDLGLKEINTV